MSTTWGQLSSNLINKAKEKNIPLIGQFELTSRCNLQCKMCYVCNSAANMEVASREYSDKEWISLAKEARDAGMLYLLLTGGEVFLRQDFKKIYEEISMMGLNVVLYTNGTLITPEISRWLGRIPPSKVEVTLYGASPDTYEKVCGSALGFNQAIRGIDLLLSEGITVKIKTTVVKGNAKDFDKIGEIADKRGVELGIVSYISPRRDGSLTYPDGERLSQQEMTEFKKHANDYFIKKEGIRSIKNKSVEKMTSNKLIDPSNKKEADAYLEESFNCDAGKCTFWVTWDGRMTPCGLMNEPAVYPFSNGLSNSWEKLIYACSNVPVCEECSSCSLRKECICCPARLKNETGFYNKPAKYLCELAQNRKILREASDIWYL